MLFFLDTANVEEIETGLEWGMVDGVTTNPSLIAQQGKPYLPTVKEIAHLVQERLTEEGFQIDLLNEFDTRLNGYRALALVSIHNDSCDEINPEATGFKVAAAVNTHDFNRASRLTECLRDRYGKATDLRFHADSITTDMREYHAFSEIDPNTIAAIIETGFLYLDQKLLVNETDRVAEGVVQGILCFARNENIEPTPLPTFMP